MRRATIRPGETIRRVASNAVVRPAVRRQAPVVDDSAVRSHLARADCRIELLPGFPDPLAFPPIQRWQHNPDVIKTHVAALQSLAKADLPLPQQAEGDGIVICGGGGYWSMICLAARMARDVCDLPIQIWHRDNESIGDELSDLGDVTFYRTNAYPNRILGGWESKAVSLLHCGFNRVLFMDADAYFVADPRPWLEQATADSPFVYWQDLPNQFNRVTWARTGIDAGIGQRIPPVQGGQYAIHRPGFWRGLVLFHWMCQHSDYWFDLGFGDQDCVRILLAELRESVYGLCLGQSPWSWPAYILPYDGKPLVVHRCRGKLYGNAGDVKHPHLPGEDRLWAHRKDLLAKRGMAAAVAREEASRPPIVVYHAAGMGNWKEIVREQFALLRSSGLVSAMQRVGDRMRVTHVGEDLNWLIEEAARQDVPIRIVKTAPEVGHGELFAIQEVERAAKQEGASRPILYFHTKGASCPNDNTRLIWRKAMNTYVVAKWRENMEAARGLDAAGWNWVNTGGVWHFSGNFWIANPDFIRRLPDFTEYYRGRGCDRWACELWFSSLPGARMQSVPFDDTSWDRYHYYKLNLPAVEPQVTWLSAATPNYSSDLARLQASFPLLGNGHLLKTSTIHPRGKWRGCDKFPAMREMLREVTTRYAFWIDADCEFLTPLLLEDLTAPGTALTAVRHFAFDNPGEQIPPRLMNRVVPGATGYWQSCMFGGEVAALWQMLDEMRWIEADERGYDEHAVCLYLYSQDVCTLPCRYATPSSFDRYPREFRERYEQRAGGAPRIIHHNRETNR